MMLPTEGTQQRSAMVRGTTRLQGNTAPSYSKASLKRTNSSRKTSPFTTQSMKVPTNTADSLNMEMCLTRQGVLIHL